MFSLPTFLSFPWSLPSLSSISLPANIQRRFLSYILKRTLGRFVRPGSLDVERIQAQIGEGLVEIEGLQVDDEAINDLIPPDLPVMLVAGSLFKVTARIPFPNLWSAPFSIDLDTLELDFRLTPPSSKGKAPETPRRTSPNTSHKPLSLSPSLDLAGSVTTAADEFLHQELDAYEEAELDRSIRQSLVLSQNDPFNNDDLPGTFPSATTTTAAAVGSGETLPVNQESTTVLAGVIERVLARLDFRVRNIRIRITNEDALYGGTFELRIGRITYADESGPFDAASGEKTTIRVVRVSSVELYLDISPKQSQTSPTTSSSPLDSRRSASISTSESSEESEYEDDGGYGDDMIMSQAVADLRQSTIAMSMTSGASVYEDALSEQAASASEDEGSVPTPPSKPAAPNVRMGQPGLPAPEKDEKKETASLILSFGSEDVVFRMKTTRSLQPTAPSSVLPEPQEPDIAATGAPATSSITVQMNLEIDTITCCLLPRQMAAVLSASQCLTSRLPGQPTASDDVKTSGPKARLLLGLSVRAVHAAIIYDIKSHEVPESELMISKYFAKSATASLPIAHLKLRITSIAGAMNLSTASTEHPLLKVEVGDLSVFEVTGKMDESEPEGGTFPILIFDTNMLQQYGTPSTSAGADEVGFPEYDSLDWRDTKHQRKGRDEKPWKVRPKGRGVLRSAATSDTSEPVISVRLPIDSGSAANIKLHPLHIFLDLSLIERLLPLMRSISPAIRKSHDSSVPLTPVQAYRTGQPARSPAQATSPANLETAVIACALLRLDIRCPAPPKHREAWGEGDALRSGIVTLDVHNIQATLFGQPQSLPSSVANTIPQTRMSQSGQNGPVQMIVNCRKTICFFCRAPDRKSSAFLIVGPLTSDASDGDGQVLLPSVTVHGRILNQTAAREVSTQNVICAVPSIQSQIRKSTVEGLQFFADDITHWLDGAFADGSRPKPRDELKMIGSRFFGGSKASSSTSSSIIDDDDDEEDPSSAFVLRISITEFDTKLYVPRISKSPKSIDGDQAQGERILALRVSDIETTIESNTTDRATTTFTLNLMDAELANIPMSGSSVVHRIMGRTTPPTLATRHTPLVHLQFTSSTDPVTEGKSTGIQLVLSSATFSVNSDIDWVQDLAAFAKTPEGVFEDVVPSELTRINLELQNCSVHLKAPHLSGAIVVVLGNAALKTDLVSDAEDSSVECALSRCSVLAIDDINLAGDLVAGYPSSRDAWQIAGYASLVELLSLDCSIWRDLSGSKEIMVDVIQPRVKITACADSLATIGELVGDLATIVPQKPVKELQEPSDGGLEKSIDVFASVDENAFNQVVEMSYGTDFIDDDLPTNLDYLDKATRSSVKGENGEVPGESLRSWQSGSMDPEHNFTGDIKGETIRILMDEPFDMPPDYWESLSETANGLENGTSFGQIRLQVSDAQIGVFLHDGFDWQKTRRAIEDEIKAVRRKLEKIRQLLASGQKADESMSMDNARSVLFNSVYIGLDERKDDLDSAALLAAIEEELDDMATGGGDTASQSSWQTDFPPGQGHRVKDKTRKTRLRGKRLTRSKRPQIEISLSGIQAAYDLFPAANDTASRANVTVKSMEILDHIKTSTWKKFLTEMKSDSRGNVRETDADMVRVELINVRPDMANTRVAAFGRGVPVGEETRLRAKILPLRLHVDQDALDFFKHFFSFSSTPPASLRDGTAISKKGNTDSTTDGPFFQHIEIFPIELKLDYKPKRVDFAALREGKTIELMNFFHFDGAEMTLRHITISGISGWPRLSTTLQDIWTPDVKANQLADVISGVSPIRSMVNVGSGVADLILLPIEQYKKDGRVTRGVQRGTSSFVKSTAMEMMKLGARLATGTQVVLEKAETVLGGKNQDVIVGEIASPPITGQATDLSNAMSSSIIQGFGGINEDRSGGVEEGSEDEGFTEVVSRYANQPGGAKEGVQAAYQSLSKNVNAAAQTILAVPMEVYERSGDDGPLKAVVRAVPIAVLKPMIGASEAVSKTLLGVRNSLDPQGRSELGDKYK